MKCCDQGSTENEKLIDLASYLKVISDTNRLRILCLLKKQERCVCLIQAKLGISQNLVSHHLKILKDAKLVVPRSQGKWTHYRLNEEKMAYYSNLYKQIIIGGKHAD